MKIIRFTPNVILSLYIDHFWGWESEKNEIIQLPTLLAGTGAELYFHYKTPFQYQLSNDDSISCGDAHLFCVRNKPINLLPSCDIGFIAVRFKAGMLSRFTQIPGSEFLDQIVNVEEIWGITGKKLLIHLLDMQTSMQRVELIQSFLIKHLRNKSSDIIIEKAISILYIPNQTISIQNLAKDIGLGHRQLERRFKSFSGQSPSNFRSLKRFQHTIRKLMLDTTLNTLDVALTNGYFDQAHLIHDFKSRIGISPTYHLHPSEEISTFRV